MKIVVVGSGSSYTPELINGIIKRNDVMNLTEVSLVDCEDGKHKQEIICELTKRMLKKHNINATVTTHIGWKEALVGADFVVTQLRVGLLDARIKDEKIPAKYGMLGQETNGAGGFFKALRTIPVIDRLVNDVREICPNAWIINFTNPAGIVSQYINTYNNFPNFVGVCNVPIHLEKGIKKLENNDNLNVNLIGLNHFIFVNSVLDGNKEILTKVIDDVVKEETDELNMSNILEEEWNPLFLHELGVIPCGYLRYYYKKSNTLNHALECAKNNNSRAEVVKEVEKELFEIYAREETDEMPPQLEKRGGAFYSDAACGIISSIIQNDDQIHYVNVKNTGTLPFLKNDDVCEMPVKFIDGEIVRCSTNNELPEYITIDILKMKNYENQLCSAVNTKDLNKLFRTFVLNALVDNDTDGKKLFDELFEAHKKYLTYLTK